LPDAELPVLLHLDESGAWFGNGIERVVVPEVSREGQQWTLRFPAFNNTLVLQRDGDRLAGELTLVKRGYEQVMPVNGTPAVGYRFVSQAAPAADVTGRWAVQFIEPEGEPTPAVGEFDQQGALVTGTFLTPTGDYRYLAGEMDGNTLLLSTFDGAHAFVFRATLGEDGDLSGDFWSGTRWHQPWTGTPDYDARLPDPYSLTWIKEGYDGLSFTFPDLDGRPVSLSDEKYRDKVVLVTLSGTWCPNCADEVAFLSDYYRENHQRGLEIITLLYEHFEEFDRAAEQGRALVQEHGIEYDVLIAGLSDKTLAAETLPMLNAVVAYPTIIFVDRAGEVRGIHTGFTGPGTGPHYEAFVGEFSTRMDELLAKSPPTGLSESRGNDAGASAGVD
jgi:thiol-disulfide isomerase/thioredoxin